MSWEAPFGMTEEEIAQVLSREEGRTVTRQEVMKIECQAIRKLRSLLNRRGITFEDVNTDEVSSAGSHRKRR